MRTVSDDERRARIAVRHALAPDAWAGTVEAAVDAMTCLHATEPANVYLSAWARTDCGREDVDRALYDDRTVVRQLAMRRTVFAFPRALLPGVLASSSARVAAQQRARLAKDVVQSGIADDGAAWVERTCGAVLEEIRRAPATTVELRERVPGLDVRLHVAPGTTYGGDIPVAPRVLTVLASDGVVVRGANAAGWKVSRPWWTAAEDWFGEALPTTGEREGYAELVGRWLWSFGPGTESDLVWWLGATKGAVRRALDDVGAVAVELEDGAPAWLHPDDVDEVGPAAPWAALLPALDPTAMGWKERGFYLGDHAARIFDRNGNGGPTAWWDGRIVGGWGQREDGTVVVVPAGRLPRGSAGPLGATAERLTAWLDGDVVRTIYQSPLSREWAAGQDA